MKIKLIKESVLEVNDDKFLYVLRQIKEDTSNEYIWKICNFLITAINLKVDINTNYNNLSTKAPDKVIFVPDSQWSKNKKIEFTSEIYIGRFISKIINLNRNHHLLKGIPLSDGLIEIFVNKFKSILEKDLLVDKIKVVKGKDIAKYYKHDNYFNKLKGSLPRSCMSQVPENYFDIYVKNEENISMVIILEDNGKIRSRALLWRVFNIKDKNWSYFLDRVYYCDQYEVDVMAKWFRETYEGQIIDRYELHDCIIPIKDIKYEKYPYLDSISYLYVKRAPFKNIPYPFNFRNKFLCAGGDIFRNRKLVGNLFKTYKLQTTHGDAIDY
jgi:hypothetical protein